MIGMMCSALASKRTLPDAKPPEIDGSHGIPASTELFWTRVGMSGPLDLKSLMSFSPRPHFERAFSNSGYCCDPTPGKATVFPLSSQGDFNGESIGTKIAVCSRMLM